MADCNRLKCQDIPFLIDGFAKIVKSVNKQTTCSDVINKLTSRQCPLAVFVSVNGIEKELPGQTKLLKAWRAHGSSDRVVFVLKKSEHTMLKRTSSGLLTEIKEQRRNSKRIAKASLKKVADLAFYVRYQKKKVQNMKRTFDEMENTCDDRVKKVMKHSTSSSSMDSMDDFLAKTDLEKMSRFLSFCGGVTDHHLGLRQSSNTPTDKGVFVPVLETRQEIKQVKNNSIKIGLKNIKTGLQRTFSFKSKAAKRSTSAGTISSTDSGFNSVTSDGQCHQDKSLVAELAKRPTFMDSNLGDAPCHSTPMIARSFGKVECDTEENDPFNMSFYDEIEGKDVILKKFIADQEQMSKKIDTRASIGCYGFLPEVDDHDIPSRFSLPAFRSQKKKCRVLCDNNCDSDSDTSSAANDSAVWNTSQLDNAFIDSFEDIPSSDFVTPRNTTLRRVSAISNLNTFSQTLRRESAMSNLNKFSQRVIPVDIEDDYTSFNYSFDCTFPRMDEFQSVDLSAEGFSHVNDIVGDSTFGGDSEDNLTRELLKDMCDDTVVESDDVNGSMQSGSKQVIMCTHL